VKELHKAELVVLGRTGEWFAARGIRLTSNRKRRKK
jgi:hypothetical protein